MLYQYYSIFCFFVLLIIISLTGVSSCENKSNHNHSSRSTLKKIHESGGEIDHAIKYGSEVLLEKQLRLLEGKRIAIVANQTTIVYDRIHLVDTLLKISQTYNIKLVKVFAPEHGFRGDIEAGENIKDQVDVKTGLPIISLYGKNKKPTAAQLKDVDVVIYDIQDVGARFYTYISTLSYVMDACAEYGKKLIVTDRPNPNGDYVDGPMMETPNFSFVGMHKVPIVYGLTVGEYAGMIKGEKWSASGSKLDNLDLAVIQMEGYNHSKTWEELKRKWIAPSPNLPTPNSARYYPILCWYEGTNVSIGRGTNAPFEQIGFPYHLGCALQIKKDSILFKNAPGKNPPVINGYTTLLFEGIKAHAVEFVPISIKGKAHHPLHEGIKCSGVKIDTIPENSKLIFKAGVALLKNFYNEYYTYFVVNELPKPQSPFFNSFFEKLVGSSKLRKAVENNIDIETIVNSWRTDLTIFKKIRKKYLLYSDFE